MTQIDPSLQPVLDRYPDDCRPLRIEPLGSAGGFSGARFWRLQTPRGPLCLRRWPPDYPDRAALEFIQAVLWHAERNGFSPLPTPIQTRDGAGYVASGGHLWELTRWLPGRADYLPERRPQKLAAAFTALAQFHLAAADFPLVRPAIKSPGIAQRIEQLDLLRTGGLDRIRLALDAAQEVPPQWSSLVSPGRRLLELFPQAGEPVRHKLAALVAKPVPIQPCIRDVWHDHVLFDEDQVSGLIDFGAMRPDNVAGDVARLLGSMAADDPAAWQRGLAAYEIICPLSPDERQMVVAFDQSTTLMAGLNWLEWTVVQGREFDDPAAVVHRVQEIIARLEHLAGHCDNWRERES